MNWLILEMTNSPLYLGLLNLFRAVPMFLLTLLAGVVVDRMERRRLLMISQGAAMVLAFVLAVLVSSGAVQVWHIFVIGTLRGAIMSFNAPARQTLISDLVPRNDLANAVAINSATMNLTRVLGPTLGGLLIAGVGISSPFYLNGLSFLAVLYTLHVMEMPAMMAKSKPAAVWQEMWEGLTYIRGNPVILALVLIAVVPMFLGQPYQAMLTVFARDVLDIGPVGLGILTSASAVGSVSGALLLASLGDFRHKGALMLWAMLGFGAVLLFFSLSPWPLTSILLVVVVGAMGTIYNVSNWTVLQMRSPDNLRGRLLSTLFLSRALVPLGTAMAGALATVIGAPWAMGTMGALVAAFAIVIWVSVPNLVSLD